MRSKTGGHVLGLTGEPAGPSTAVATAGTPRVAPTSKRNRGTAAAEPKGDDGGWTLVGAQKRAKPVKRDPAFNKAVDAVKQAVTKLNFGHIPCVDLGPVLARYDGTPSQVPDGLKKLIKSMGGYHADIHDLWMAFAKQLKGRPREALVFALGHIRSEVPLVRPKPPTPPPKPPALRVSKEKAVVTSKTGPVPDRPAPWSSNTSSQATSGASTPTRSSRRRLNRQLRKAMEDAEAMNLATSESSDSESTVSSDDTQSTSSTVSLPKSKPKAPRKPKQKPKVEPQVETIQVKEVPASAPAVKPVYWVDTTMDPVSHRVLRFQHPTSRHYIAGGWVPVDKDGKVSERHLDHYFQNWRLVAPDRFVATEKALSYNALALAMGDSSDPVEITLQFHKKRGVMISDRLEGMLKGISDFDLQVQEAKGIKVNATFKRDLAKFLAAPGKWRNQHDIRNLVYEVTYKVVPFIYSDIAAKMSVSKTRDLEVFLGRMRSEISAKTHRSHPNFDSTLVYAFYRSPAVLAMATTGVITAPKQHSEVKAEEPATGAGLVSKVKAALKYVKSFVSLEPIRRAGSKPLPVPELVDRVPKMHYNGPEDKCDDMFEVKQKGAVTSDNEGMFSLQTGFYVEGNKVAYPCKCTGCINRALCTRLLRPALPAPDEVTTDLLRQVMRKLLIRKDTMEPWTPQLAYDWIDNGNFTEARKKVLRRAVAEAAKLLAEGRIGADGFPKQEPVLHETDELGWSPSNPKGRGVYAMDDILLVLTAPYAAKVTHSLAEQWDGSLIEGVKMKYACGNTRFDSGAWVTETESEVEPSVMVMGDDSVYRACGEWGKADSASFEHSVSAPLMQLAFEGADILGHPTDVLKMYGYQHGLIGSVATGHRAKGKLLFAPARGASQRAWSPVFGEWQKPVRLPSGIGLTSFIGSLLNGTLQHFAITTFDPVEANARGTTLADHMKAVYARFGFETVVKTSTQLKDVDFCSGYFMPCKARSGVRESKYIHVRKPGRVIARHGAHPYPNSITEVRKWQQQAFVGLKHDTQVIPFLRRWGEAMCTTNGKVERPYSVHRTANEVVEFTEETWRFWTDMYGVSEYELMQLGNSMADKVEVISGMIKLVKLSPSDPVYGAALEHVMSHDVSKTPYEWA